MDVARIILVKYIKSLYVTNFFKFIKMFSLRKLVVLAVIATFCFSTLKIFADEIPSAKLITNGFRGKARVEYSSPSSDHLKISRKININHQVKSSLDDLFLRNNAKALLVSQGDYLIYERYSSWGGSLNTPLGYSMSKSLAALTVGHAICDGHIKSINDRLGDYVKDLVGTSWGDASIREVLMMSSGAFQTISQLNGHKTFNGNKRIGDAVHTAGMNENFIDIMKEEDERAYKPGSQFNYSNLDTIALGLLVQNAVRESFAKYFERTVWRSVGAESKGAWFITNKNQTSTYHGFSARPHDWIRIGQYVLREIKKDTCYGNYIKEATSAQIDSSGSAQKYGYQVWVNCAPDVDFCFVGWGGQYLLFNVAKNMILYQHATSTGFNIPLTPLVLQNFINHIDSSN